MKFLDNWHTEYASSRREFESKGKPFAQEYLTSINPIKRFFLENIWITKESARYEAAWAYVRSK
ncbi:Uncharacterised protein [uncultured archaeon]|nr:Uncharacterised protein [uncultured archaeon]